MSIELPTFRIDAGQLLQHVSRITYRGSPLYYGRDGTNRYDDPAKTYGVLYLGRDLPTALMESMFHKHQWLAATKRSVALKEVRSRLVRAVGVHEELRLADLTAPNVMAGYFGLNLEQLSSRNYTHTQGYLPGYISCQEETMMRHYLTVCSIRRGTTILLRVSPCLTGQGKKSGSVRISSWSIMWTGLNSWLTIKSVWNLIQVRRD